MLPRCRAARCGSARYSHIRQVAISKTDVLHVQKLSAGWRRFRQITTTPLNQNVPSEVVVRGSTPNVARPAFSRNRAAHTAVFAGEVRAHTEQGVLSPQTRSRFAQTSPPLPGRGPL